MVALQCGLVDVIGVMWSWCTVSSLLARAVLDTLTVFTASNSKGVCVCVCDHLFTRYAGM